MALTPKQELFVKEYLKDKNATLACKRAGYSKKTAYSCGPRLLENAGVKEAINKGLGKLIEKAGLRASDVLAEIQAVAFAKVPHAYAKDGTLLSPHDMPQDVQSALQSLETEELFEGKGPDKRKIGETRKVKMNDKLRALEMLAKHFKLLTDVQEIGNKDGQPLVILTMPANGSEASE